MYDGVWSLNISCLFRALKHKKIKNGRRIERNIRAWTNDKCLATKHHQTFVLWTSSLPFGHLVWCCLIVFDSVRSCLRVFGRVLYILKAIKHSIQNVNIPFVLVFDGRCFVRLDSHVSNMFDACMRTTLARRLVSIVSSVFDQTCFNRLAIHLSFVQPLK